VADAGDQMGLAHTRQANNILPINIPLKSPSTIGFTRVTVNG
jgi:hypothetical protein